MKDRGRQPEKILNKPLSRCWEVSEHGLVNFVGDCRMWGSMIANALGHALDVCESWPKNVFRNVTFAHVKYLGHNKRHYTFIETIFEGKTQWDEQGVDRRASGNILSWAMWVAVYQNIRLWSGKGSAHNIRCGDGSRLIDLQMILTSYHLKFGCVLNVFWFVLFHSPSKIQLPCISPTHDSLVM